MKGKILFPSVVLSALVGLGGCVSNPAKNTSGDKASNTSSVQKSGDLVDSKTLPQISRKQAGLADDPFVSFYLNKLSIRNDLKLYKASKLLGLRIGGVPFYGNVDQNDPKQRLFPSAIAKSGDSYYVAALQAGGSCQGKPLPIIDEVRYEKMKAEAQRYRNPRILDPRNWTIATNPWKFSTVVYQVGMDGEVKGEVKCWPGKVVRIVPEGDFMWYAKVKTWPRKIPAAPGQLRSHTKHTWYGLEYHKLTFNGGKAEDRLMFKNVSAAVPFAPGKWLVVKDALMDRSRGDVDYLGALYEYDEKTGKERLIKKSVPVSPYTMNHVYQKGYYVDAVPHNLVWAHGVVPEQTPPGNRYYAGVDYFDPFTGERLYRHQVRLPAGNKFGVNGRAFVFKGKDGHRYAVTWEEEGGIKGFAGSMLVGMLRSKTLDEDFVDGVMVIIDLDNPKHKIRTSIRRPVGSGVKRIVSATGEQIVLPANNLGFFHFAQKGWVVTDPDHLKIIPQRDIWDWFMTKVALR